MLHCSHCLIYCEADRLDDFVCCSACGKVLGEFFGGKFIDHSELMLDRASKMKKKIKKEKQKKTKTKTKNKHGEIEINSTDPKLTA